MTFNIENSPCILAPFDWSVSTNGILPTGTPNPAINNGISGLQQITGDNTLTTQNEADVFGAIGLSGFFPNQSVPGQFNIGGFGVSDGTGVGSGTTLIYDISHPLYPLTQTGGVVFPYNPTISERIGTKYDVTELTHTNENIHAYKNTDNVRITLSDCIWTCETFDRAIYTLAVIHFFRSYRLMDFGRGNLSPSQTPGTGRPPSPMWFSAYGDYMYYLVPVLIEQVDYSFPVDIDYVGVPDPGTDAYLNQQLQFSTSSGSAFPLGTQSDQYTWIPMKFTIGSISMVVQHSVQYWTQEFNLDDFKAGRMIIQGVGG